MRLLLFVEATRLSFTTKIAFTIAQTSKQTFSKPYEKDHRRSTQRLTEKWVRDGGALATQKLRRHSECCSAPAIIARNLSLFEGVFADIDFESLQKIWRFIEINTVGNVSMNGQLSTRIYNAARYFNPGVYSTFISLIVITVMDLLLALEKHSGFPYSGKFTIAYIMDFSCGDPPIMDQDLDSFQLDGYHSNLTGITIGPSIFKRTSWHKCIRDIQQLVISKSEQYLNSLIHGILVRVYYDEPGCGPRPVPSSDERRDMIWKFILDAQAARGSLRKRKGFEAIPTSQWRNTRSNQ